ncbi:DUF4413 domain-containing protein [Halomarina litorea]|uniref:DUF4413 domain-containing protein n=1 Tax=Halomarina litorea TaxID=2961595 RepID=UPI0020C32B49|nr:DUF4413 domain-containing protein [Halomarina sp. BCD28]
MTRFEASDPRERLGLVVDAITAHRKRDSEGVVLESDGGRVEYADRTLTLTLTDDQRGRLDDLLSEFPVFKVEQPATRKAPEGVVHVAAIADPKHAADFVEACFRQVFGADEGYQLRVVRV